MKQGDDPDEHQASERDEVQPRQRLRQVLIVTRQAPEPGRPPERALHHPAAWQQHEALLGLRELDHLQPDALRLGGLRRL